MLVHGIIIILAVPFVLLQFYLRSRIRRTIPRAIVEWRDWSASARDSPIPRNELIGRLDGLLASDDGFILLQRMTMMAPLLGVIVTAAGFILVPVESAGSSSVAGPSSGPLQIVESIKPLFLGVLLGAVLAMTNQILVIWTASWIRGQRQEAEQSLGDHVLTGHDANIKTFADNLQGATEGIHSATTNLMTKSETAAEALERMLKHSIAGVEELYKGCTDAGLAISQATTRFDEQLQSSLSGFDEGVASVGRAMDSAALTLEREVAACHATLEKALEPLNSQLDTTLESMQKVVAGSTELLTAMATTNDSVAASAESAGHAAEASAAAVESFASTADEQLTPALQGVADELKSSTSRFATALEETVASTGTLKELLVSLNGTTNGLCDFTGQAGQQLQTLVKIMDHLARATNAHIKHLQTLPSQLEESIRSPLKKRRWRWLFGKRDR